MLADDKGSFTDRNDPRIALFATLRFWEGNETDCSHRKTRDEGVMRHIQGSMLIHLIGAQFAHNCGIYLYYVTINGNAQRKIAPLANTHSRLTIHKKEKIIFEKDISN